MAHAVWQHHTRQPNYSTANTVLALLEKAKKQEEREFLIYTIQNGQWRPRAEQALLGLSRSAQEPLEVRRLSVETLLYNCDVNTYVPLALEIIVAHEKGLARCQAFCSTLNQGNRLRDLSEKNRRMVRRTGFEMLNALPEKDLGLGSGVASHLGFLLGDDFAPEINYYLSNGKVQKDYFADKVRNVREWYSENKWLSQDDSARAAGRRSLLLRTTADGVRSRG